MTRVASASRRGKTKKMNIEIKITVNGTAAQQWNEVKSFCRQRAAEMATTLNARKDAHQRECGESGPGEIVVGRDEWQRMGSLRLASRRADTGGPERGTGTRNGRVGQKPFVGQAARRATAGVSARA